MQNSNYNHKNIENEIYKYWEKNKFFKPKKSKKKHFSIVIPPPNVTGSLHMGHALNNSLQDLLIRYYRMNGYETLWQPGTDHAGIATQAVVEKNLLKEGIKKNHLGRDKFVEEIWKWKQESGDQILTQLKKLGCSCDWSRNRFTMDKDLSEAVIKTFVKDPLNIDSMTSRCLCLKLLLECKHFMNIVISKQSVSLVNDK